MKKRLIFAMLAVVMICSFTGCASNKAAQDESVTLTIMGKQTDLQKSYMTSIFDRYQKITGNKLDIIAYEDSEYERAAADAFEKGKGSDIFLHFHNADLNRFRVSDNFYYLNDQDWADELTDSAKAYCMDKDGNLLGLPFWENSVSGCYYNKTLLNSLGLKPASTQAEFDMLCQALADTGYTPICWPANGCSWMVQFGLDPIFADDPKLLDNINNNEISYSDIPAVKDMVQWISDAADKGWFGEKYLETGWDQISSEMASGQAVMTFIWDTWFYTDFEKGNKYTVDDFALMPVFLNTVENGTYEGGNLNMMMVNKNSDKLDIALDFLEFCASEENYNIAFDGISTVNCFKGQNTNIQSEMVTDAQKSIKANERVSTAASRIVGYSAEDMVDALNMMLRKKISVDQCVKLMDEKRIAEIKSNGASND